MTRLQFGAFGDIESLLCPRCGEDYLHQCGVTVYDRGEDAEMTTVTTVDDGLVGSHLVPSNEAANPSSRRDGIAIMFTCETCDDGWFELTFAQHKGMTHVAWRDAVRRDRRWGSLG